MTLMLDLKLAIEIFARRHPLVRQPIADLIRHKDEHSIVVVER